MAKKGGRNRMKRLSAPKLWDLERKKKRFTFKPTPGPHSIAKSYPLGVLLRDLVGLVKTAGELRYAVNAGKVLVDGRVWRTPSFPVGLFDDVTIPSENLSLRLVPSPRGLIPSKIAKEEAEKKLCAVSSKVIVRGGRLRYGFHDGRSMAGEGLDLRPGDAVLMQLPDQRVLSEVRLAKESLALVVSGERAGEVGRVLEVKRGTVTRERMVKISLPGGEAEIPSRLVFPVGIDKPAITVSISR